MELVLCFDSTNGLNLEKMRRREEGLLEGEGVQSPEDLLLTILEDIQEGAWY